MVESVNVIKSERCDQDEADGDHQLQDGDVDGDVEWDGEWDRDGDGDWEMGMWSGKNSCLCEEGWPVSESLRQ